MAAARTDLEEIETERDALSQAADTLVERRDALAAETQQAETQMKNLQEQLVQLSEDLAERSNALAEVEAGIADQQREAGQPARAAASGFILGERYEYGPVIAVFSDGGSFEMENSITGKAMSGTFTLEEDILELSDAEGDLGDAEFPIRCTIVPETAGFTLEETDNTCGLLSGVSFSRAAE